LTGKLQSYKSYDRKYYDMADSRTEEPNSTQGDEVVSSRSERIKVIIIGVDRLEQMHFIIKMTTQMGKLKKSYCERMGISEDSIKFTFLGWTISDSMTASDVNMKYGDRIRAIAATAEIKLERNSNGDRDMITEIKTERNANGDRDMITEIKTERN